MITSLRHLILLLCLLVTTGLSLRAQVMLTMEVEMEKKGKRVEKGSAEMTMVSDGDRSAVITRTSDTEMRMIVDNRNKTTTTVTEVDGKLTAVRMPRINVKTGKQKGFEGTFRATGERRTILGYDTEKFVVTDGGDVTDAWVADIPGFDYALISEGLVGDATPVPDVPGVASPVVLEAHTSSKGGKEVTHMYIRAIGTGSDVDLGLLEVPAGAEMQDMSALLRMGGQ